MKDQSQFDNSNSGALFAQSVEGVLSGPWQFGKKQDNKHILVAELKGAGKEHDIRVHVKKKDGSAGKVVATGTFKAIASNGKANLPAARGNIGDLQVVLWKQDYAGGSMYQVKPDAREQRELPTL